ncbi:hypothetical protein ABIE66_004708 [Peribacillus sp. B2I2]
MSLASYIDIRLEHHVSDYSGVQLISNILCKNDNIVGI